MKETLEKQNTLLPSSFTKKYKNAKLIEILSDEVNWGVRPLAIDEKGRRKLIKLNSLLFDYIETLGDFDFFIEPYDYDYFELMPANVSRQGIAFSVDRKLNGLELDLFFYPCDYSDDPHRNLPYAPLRVSVATIFDVSIVDRLVKKYFPGNRKSAVIPFSPYRMAELEGFFMDDYDYTEKICRKAVEGGAETEIKNCEHFLSFVKHAGLDRQVFR